MLFSTQDHRVSLRLSARLFSHLGILVAEIVREADNEERIYKCMFSPNSPLNTRLTPFAWLFLKSSLPSPMMYSTSASALSTSHSSEAHFRTTSRIDLRSQLGCEPYPYHQDIIVRPSNASFLRVEDAAEDGGDRYSVTTGP